MQFFHALSTFNLLSWSSFYHPIKSHFQQDCLYILSLCNRIKLNAYFLFITVIFIKPFMLG